MQMDELLDRMNQAERLAQSQSSLVHVLTWEETQAGIWEPPPEDSLAVATLNGLLLNCVNSGLYMVRFYTLETACKIHCHETSCILAVYKAEQGKAFESFLEDCSSRSEFTTWKCVGKGFMLCSKICRPSPLAQLMIKISMFVSYMPSRSALECL